MPVLTENGFSATVFIVSDYIGRRNDWEVPPVGLGVRDLLTWQQAGELARNGIEIGSHTSTHPDLRRVSDSEAQREIAGSRMKIEDHLGQEVVSFAYPFGETNAIAKEYVKKEFQAACTTVLQRANGKALHSLPRIDMYYLRTQRMLQRLLDGQMDWYLNFRRLGRIVRRMIVS
jgi:peptidoglycan/xylan/chitin deacetylase (PgdA/CDA1 family)